MTGGMSDNDVDDLARVLAERISDPGSVTPRRDGESVSRWAARAVLASGVVVSARDVQALANPDDLPDSEVDADLSMVIRLGEPYPEHSDADLRRAWRDGFESAGVRLRSLLREPATDAAPVGETQGRDKTCGRCYGCGQIINDDVRVALVRPIPCPECTVSLPEGGEQRG